MAKLTVTIRDEAGFDATYSTTYPKALEGRLAETLAPLYGYPETVEAERLDQDGHKVMERVPNPTPKASWLVDHFVHQLLGQIRQHDIGQKVRVFEESERARPKFVPEISVR